MRWWAAWSCVPTDGRTKAPCCVPSRCAAAWLRWTALPPPTPCVTQHWLDFLSALVPPGSRLPVVLVITRLDTIQAELRAAEATRLVALVRATLAGDRAQPPEESKAASAVASWSGLAVADVIALDYDDAAGVAQLRGRLFELTRREAQQTPVPTGYSVALRRMLERADTALGRGVEAHQPDVQALIVPRAELESFVTRAAPSVFADQALLGRCITFFHAMGLVRIAEVGARFAVCF